MKVLLTLSPQSLTVAGGAIGLSALGATFKGVGDILTGGSDVLQNVIGGFQTAVRSFTTFLFIDLQAMMLRTKIERRLIQHEIPGREGDILQDLGGKSTAIHISGRWIFENEPQDAITQLLKTFSVIANLMGNRVGWNWLRVEMIKALARINVPLILASDLFTGPVLLKEVSFALAGGMPNVYEYSMTMVEWNPALSLIGTLAVGGSQLLTQGLTRGF